MAKRIKAHLERHGVEVVETRPDGRDVSLGERCRISNTANPDLFVSLHSNATGTLSTGPDGWGECPGVGVLCVRPIWGTLQGSKGYSESGGWSGARHPLYAHLGQSRDDVKLLKDSAYREKLAAAEARGILDYLGIAWKEVSELNAAVDKLAAAGIIDSPHLWKQLNFTEDSVRLLIIKMASALK